MPRKKTGTRIPKKIVSHPPEPAMKRGEDGPSAKSSPQTDPATPPSDPKSGESSLKIVRPPPDAPPPIAESGKDEPLETPSIEERIQIVEAEGEVKNLKYPELTASVIVALAKIRSDRHPILKLTGMGIPNWKKVPEMWLRIMYVAEAKSKMVTWVDETIHTAVRPEPVLAHSFNNLVRFVAIAAGMEGLMQEVYRGLAETAENARAELNIQLKKDLAPQEKSDE
jgi:hypothetical protein